MAWSPQQVRAIDQVGRWLQDRSKPFFQLAGYAGTGKTTLAKHLVETVNGRVFFAAYTGKAAHVLSKAGVPNVSTIHKLIYSPKSRSEKRLRELEAERAKLRQADPLPETLLAKVEAFIIAERANLSRPMFQLNLESPLNGAALLVVDEYSMIDEQMGNDLLSFGVPVLALGDPGQLPPVYGKSFFSGTPDILLTEIHRQAADNPIIRMSQDIRAGRELEVGSYGSSAVMTYRQAQGNLAERVLSTDQLLVGRNETRRSSNMRARQLRGRDSILPQTGDKLICLRNNHDSGLLNGQIWRATQDAVDDGFYPILHLEGDDATQIIVSSHRCYFEGQKVDHWTRKDAEEFDYGEAITVHKAQGSQWPNALLLDEWYGRDRKQWLYTAVTRASESITIVKMGNA